MNVPGNALLRPCKHYYFLHPLDSVTSLLGCFPPPGNTPTRKWRLASQRGPCRRRLVSEFGCIMATFTALPPRPAVLTSQFGPTCLTRNQSRLPLWWRWFGRWPFVSQIQRCSMFDSSVCSQSLWSSAYALNARRSYGAGREGICRQLRGILAVPAAPLVEGN